MRRIVVLLAVLLVVTAPCSDAVDLRLGAGAEVIPLRYIDLDNLNTGVGADIRADIVWGAFSTTSLEMGYREFSYGDAWPGHAFGLRRFAFVQRFYPLYRSHLRQSPYLGVGLSANNREQFSLAVTGADYAGWIAMIGVELPVGKQLYLDPAVRWDFFFNTDYFYSGVGLSVHVIWALR